MLSVGIFPSGLFSQVFPAMIFFFASSVHRNGRSSHFWIETLVLPMLKHPTNHEFLRSHPFVQFDAEVPLSSPSSQSSYHSRMPSPQYHKLASSTMICCWQADALIPSTEHFTLYVCGISTSVYLHVVSKTEALFSVCWVPFPQSIVMF